jgi:hypothetical protein
MTKTTLKVILESPYSGNIKKNVKYARLCVKDSILRGESPLASHLLYTQEGILNDEKKSEREIGVAMGLEWLPSADLQVFYTDYGMSKGMKEAEAIGEKNGITRVYRKLFIR